MKIALVGNPNAGKSSVFNQLTGLRQKTGNFPGVTVDKRSGKISLPNGEVATVIDLPGIYSLYPNSTDERIVADILCKRADPSFLDVIIYVADVTNLERQLLLCSQLIDLKFPMVMALTMTDIAEVEGTAIDVEKLQKTLGVRVVKINGRTGAGIKELLYEVKEAAPADFSFIEAKAMAPAAVEQVGKIIDSKNDYVSLLATHHFKWLSFLNSAEKSAIEKIVEQEKFSSIHLQVRETMARYEKIISLLEKVISKKQSDTLPFTEKADRILTHKILGTLIFLGILFLMFQAIFEWAALPMEMIDAAFSRFSGWISETLPPGMFNDLISEGVIPGIAGVVIFIPQITILFTLIVFLEDVGYMSRVIFLADKTMRKFGLNGRSLVSLFSGLACAVPAIMATRTITNWKERIITIMVTPLISCSAGIPVFVILVALVVPQDARFGPFNAAGMLMLGLYLLGALAAFVAAFVMNKIIKTQDRSYLVMELPSYKTPHWKNIVLTVFDKVKIFVFEAGKVIFLISIILWFLASFGPGEKMQTAEENVITRFENENLPDEELDDAIAAARLEVSYAGHVGRFIEPVIKPLGFDWKIGIALITSFAAREVFVGTMATIYSVGSEENEPILEKLRTQRNPQNDELVFRPAAAMSLLIFYLFALQCMSTIAVVRRETKSWKWPAIQFAYMTALAYLGSLLTFQLMK